MANIVSHRDLLVPTFAFHLLYMHTQFLSEPKQLHAYIDQTLCLQNNGKAYIANTCPFPNNFLALGELGQKNSSNGSPLPKKLVITKKPAQLPYMEGELALSQYMTRQCATARASPPPARHRRRTTVGKPREYHRATATATVRHATTEEREVSNR